MSWKKFRNPWRRPKFDFVNVKRVGVFMLHTVSGEIYFCEFMDMKIGVSS